MNADENLKFDKDGKPRPWTIEDLEEEFGPEKNTDHQEDEIGLQGDNLRANYRPPPVTFKSEKWLPTRLSKRIRPAADSIRECTERSRDLNERIDCLKRAKKDYREISKDFMVELDRLHRNGEKNYDLYEAFLVVSGYIDETDRALREAIAEYRKRPAPAEQGGQEEEPELNVFRKDGDTWEIVFEGEKLPRFKHIDGFSYLQYLLEHPTDQHYRDREIDAISLYCHFHSLPVPDDTGPDSFSKRDFASRLSEEGKKPGWADDQVDKARSNVTRAIGRAKEAILEKGGVAGAKLYTYLDNTIVTGKKISCHPAKDHPHKNIPWIF